MTQDIYDQSQYQIDPLVGILTEASIKFLREFGSFLPHAALFSLDGEVNLHGAAPEEEMVSSLEVLPLLHEGLRHVVATGKYEAVAVAEQVMVSPDGGEMKDAIKVSFENNLGLSVAFYTPFKKGILGVIKALEWFLVNAEPEIIEAWPDKNNRE